MATPEEKIWLNEEADRLLTYQHQHRGLSFLKLCLPPTTDRKVNLVGLDNHIYRGSIPKLPEDQLPANVDEKSIDEEALYKEIRDMNFPPVPPQEPLGSRRRIGGSYTLTKRMTLAPVKVDCGEELEEIQILGTDGSIYKGVAKHASKLELERQIRGTKRSIQIARQQSSSRGFIEPALVTLQSKPFGRQQKSFVELPAANVGKIIELILSQNKTRRKDEITKTEPQPAKEKDDSHSEKTEETKDTEENESEDTESKEEYGETESTEGSEETENKEDSEDLETKEESEDKENTDVSEDIESKAESEATGNVEYEE